MRKDFHFIISEKGFSYPLVLLIISLIFLFLFKNLQTYRQDIILAEKHIEYLVSDTILQMSIDQLKYDLEKKNVENIVSYSFPVGDSTFILHQRSEHEFLYELYIRINNNSYYDKGGYIKIDQ